VHRVGFVIRIYHNARSSECQNVHMYQHFKFHMTQYNCARRYNAMLSGSYTTTMQSNIHGLHLYHNPVVYPGILFVGGSTNSVEDRTERTVIWGR